MTQLLPSCLLILVALTDVMPNPKCPGCDDGILCRDIGEEWVEKISETCTRKICDEFDGEMKIKATHLYCKWDDGGCVARSTKWTVIREDGVCWIYTCNYKEMTDVKAEKKFLGKCLPPQVIEDTQNKTA
ncbi:uncharacterized protein LOC128248175 [Octopus bimaculoides]|uniref:uncharacterized protein LOC128248175 n=1 Tax=Octopus bimaculoides TaxID=37653 RepID=UPI0022E80FC8|nr:uncharacterized protein LOC128248175 [Octopus bimaculoides]